MKFTATFVALSLLAIRVSAHELPSRYAAQRRGTQFVTGPCASDSDCQQGCCGFISGKCAGPAVAQTNGSGGCGHGNASPNCNVAAALGLGGSCIAGGVKDGANDPAVQAVAAFVANLDNLPFTPASGGAPPAGNNNAAPPSAPVSAASQSSKKTVFEVCAADSECQQGCCGFTSGKCAGPAVAQTNGSGGCGHGNAVPNCNVAAAIGLGGNCIAGAVKDGVSDPTVQAAAAFTAQLDGLPFTPARR
ncbi:hypothetical protein DFH09DRAFT_1261650 [Mycena vulgaris]|nr:hypothetical protein DFH09DRAFT_1261650 [Mycena vulgaris]